MKTITMLCAAALLVPALAGCGGSSSSTNTSGPVFPVPHSASATLSNGLTATLIEDRSTVSVGGTVTYTVTLTNSTAQPITYQPFLGSGVLTNVPATLIITNSSSQMVYPVGPMPNVVGIGPSVTLVSGQSVSATQAVITHSEAGLTVSQGYAAPGGYTANAYFSVIPGTSPNTAQTIEATAGPLTVTAQ